ncbi:MAG: putative lipoprotein YmbA [Flavobacteriales bacterium]|jgi:uncharacterized lipoprotein YmbA
MTKRVIFFLSMISLFSACTSSGPATSFYALYASEENADLEIVSDVESNRTFTTVTATATATATTTTTATTTASVVGEHSLGLGPVELVAYLDQTAIVSRISDNQLLVSGFHAWAEPLDEGIARVMSAELSRNGLFDFVSAFPWDTRARPNMQMQLKITQLDGVRGDVIHLQAQYQLLRLSDQMILARGNIGLDQSSTSSQYSDYVSAINSLVLALSKKIETELNGVEL